MHHTLVVNARASTVREAGTDAFEARIMAAFQAAGCSARVRMVHPRERDDALALTIEDTGTIPVIAGGDGTLNGVLPLLMHASRPVGILPLGTVNVLGRDLGLTGTLEDHITFDGEVERKAGLLVDRLLPTAIRLIAACDRLV